MIRRAIALVARETIAGKLAFIVEHHPVARHLGNYRRGRDTKALTIATNDLCLWQFKAGNQPPVDEHMVGSPDERQKCSLARQHRGPINIKFVNLARARKANSDCEGALIDQRKELVPFLRRELLGIVNALAEDLGRKDDGGSDDRPGHGTDACLVDARDCFESRAPKLAFVAQIRMSAHPHPPQSKFANADYADRIAHAQRGTVCISQDSSTEVAPEATRMEIEESSDSGKAFEAGLAQNFCDAFGIGNIVKPNHEIGTRRRSDRYVAQSEHALHHAAVDLD